MPVLLDRGPFGFRPFAASEHLRGKMQPDFRQDDADCINIGLVNNMSDTALETTERQILKLLDAAAGDILVRLKLFSLPDIPRTDLGQKHLSRLYYAGVDDLWNYDLDGLIVTGAEPRTPELSQEPYWNTLTAVIDWAEENTISAIWSCLAVHATVLHIDGISRHALSDKCFGIFEFPNPANHPLVNGAPSRLGIPHSRWNEVRANALESCGYTVLTKSAQAGVDMFLKQRRSLFIFFQGHPEYEAWTLLSEYRRDIGRYLRGERETYPSMPLGYFDAATTEALKAFQERALLDRREDLLTSFPTAQVAGKLTDTWRSAAKQIYGNWLLHMSAQKSRKPKFTRSAVT